MAKSIKPTAIAEAKEAIKVAPKKKATASNKAKQSLAKRGVVFIAMALVKFGMVVSDIRGSVGGVTFSRNSSGAVARKRTAGVNPNTVAQQAVRGLFNDVAQAWRNLSSANQDTWITQAPNYTRVNRLGETVSYTGQQLFNHLNGQLLQLGQAVVDVAIPPLSIEVATAASVVAVQTTDDIVINGLASTGGDDIIAVYATPAMSAGRRFTSKSMYRLIQIKPASTASGNLDVTTAYENIYGVTPTDMFEGSKVFFRLLRVSTVNGQAAPIQEYVGTVVN